MKSRDNRLENNRKRIHNVRCNESQETRTLRLEKMQLRYKKTFATENQKERSDRLERTKMRNKKVRANENQKEHELRIEKVRNRASTARREIWTKLNLEAFNYKEDIDYKVHPNIIIGKMDKQCVYCAALKYDKEPPGMCCANGKVELPPLIDPPEPLLSYVKGNDTLSKHFLLNIRKYNSCFQMTSFGATKIEKNLGFMPTFRIQGQVYHYHGSLLPPPDNDSKFLQIYFIGDSNEEIDQRSAIVPGTKREIIANLQELLHKHNHLVNLFKTSLERMPSLKLIKCQLDNMKDDLMHQLLMMLQSLLKVKNLNNVTLSYISEKLAWNVLLKHTDLMMHCNIHLYFGKEKTAIILI